MDLDTIRKELDKLDRSLDYIILLRLSLASLVGEVKAEQHMPIFQSDREEKIYESQRLFSEQTGLDPELLTHVSKELIAATIRIERNAEQYRLASNETGMKAIEQELNKSNQVLDDFISYMDSVKEALHEQGIKGKKVLASLSEYYRGSFNSKESD